MSTPFRPAKRSQFQPLTATSRYDCVPTVTGRLVNRVTVDARNTEHDDIRRAIGFWTLRGMSYLEAENAAAKFGVNLAARYGLSRTQVVDLADAGHAYGLSIDTSITAHTTRRTNDFIGPHTVFTVDSNEWPGGEPCACEKQSSARHQEFTIDDPGTTTAGYLQWSADLAFRAAEARTGGNGINVLAAPDTEQVTWTAIAAGRIHDTPSATGKDLGPVVIGRKYIGGVTQNGGTWTRADGTTGNGWVHVKLATRWAWIAGRSLRV